MCKKMKNHVCVISKCVVFVCKDLPIFSYQPSDIHSHTHHCIHSVVYSIATSLCVFLQTMLGVVPLGTGNDMARVMGWGSQFNDEEKLPVILKEMEFSSFHLLDRWSVQYSLADVDMSPIAEASSVSVRLI